MVFGLAEGRVRIGNCRSNKAQTMYSTDSYVTSLASSPDGTAVISWGVHNGTQHGVSCFRVGDDTREYSKNHTSPYK